MTRSLTPATPAGGNRGRQALTHYLPVSELFPPHLDRRAICGAEPSSGWSPSTEFSWERDRTNICSNCEARSGSGDEIVEPGADRTDA